MVYPGVPSSIIGDKPRPVAHVVADWLGESGVDYEGCFPTMPYRRWFRIVVPRRQKRQGSFTYPLRDDYPVDYLLPKFRRFKLSSVIATYRV
jgi:hypothetical protein